MRAYLRLAAMAAFSTIVMYGLMYLNTYNADHVWFSQTRAWMAVIMGTVMTATMLVFMRRMYHVRRLNFMILAGCAAGFLLALWLVRSQATVGDISYMKAMIPHHSIAVMTSERARIRDPRVRRLADGIIRTQVREIAEMEHLIATLENSPPPSGTPALPPDNRSAP